MKKLLTAIEMLAALLLFGAYSGHRIEMSNPDGYYQTGETAVCHVTLCEDGKPLEGSDARATVYWEGNAIKTLDFKTDGKPVEIPYRADKPGWGYFRFELLGEDGKPLSGKGIFKHWAKPTTTVEAGALFSADKIRTAVKRPDDFEAFWTERRAKLDRLPIRPEYRRLPDPAPGIKLFTVEIPCTGDYPVSAYLALPDGASPKSCPAYVDWASWMASDTDREYAIARARQGAIGFTPTWHGRPCNMPEEYYNYGTTIKIAGGTAGIEDREQWCFSGMFDRVMRSLHFVKSLPKWDGKTLVSVGCSLGGAQSVAAALDKDVTTAVINVPCFCEFDGYASGRKSSIPHINIAKRILDGDRRPLETGACYDCFNFAPMIKCEVFVCTGFTDELCPPSNVFAFYNAIPAKTNKTMCTSPFTGHYGTTTNPKAAKRLEELRGATRVFRYDGPADSGGRVSIPLKHRRSITDWNRPFGGVAMRWAVHGVDADKNHFSFGIYEFVNPKPERAIKSFHFGTTKCDGISPVILAVSAFGTDRPFPRPGSVSPDVVAQRVGVDDSTDSRMRMAYGFEDGMGEITVSAPKPLLENLKHEIVFDPTSPSRSKVLKISLPAGNYLGHAARAGSYVRLDLNMPHAIPNGTKALVIDHKIVTNAKGFSHANDYKSNPAGVCSTR